MMMHSSWGGEPRIGSPDDGGLLDYRQAARRLNISPRKLQQMVLDREVPHLRFGRMVRFHPEELDQWARAAVIQPACVANGG